MRLRLLDAICDARLFAHPFGDESWRAWRTFLSALFAETPRDSDLERFREATGRRHWPMKLLLDTAPEKTKPCATLEADLALVKRAERADRALRGAHKRLRERLAAAELEQTLMMLRALSRWEPRSTPIRLARGAKCRLGRAASIGRSARRSCAC